MGKINAVYKLTALHIEDAQYKFENGWKIVWIAHLFKVNRSTIYFHVRYNGWVRRKRVLAEMPEEVAVLYREKKKHAYQEKFKGSYTFIRAGADQRTMQTCRHSRWIKRCSICGMILASDSVEHEQL